MCSLSRLLRIWNPEGTSHSKGLDCQSPQTRSGKGASYPLKGPVSSRGSKAKPGTSRLGTAGRVEPPQTGSPGSFPPRDQGDPCPALRAQSSPVRRPDRRRRTLHSRDREAVPRQCPAHSPRESVRGNLTEKASRRHKHSHKFKPKLASSATYIIGCRSADVITPDVAPASSSLAPEAGPPRPVGGVGRGAAFLGVSVATRAIVSGSRWRSGRS